MIMYLNNQQIYRLGISNVFSYAKWAAYDEGSESMRLDDLGAVCEQVEEAVELIRDKEAH